MASVSLQLLLVVLIAFFCSQRAHANPLRSFGCHSAYLQPITLSLDAIARRRYSFQQLLDQVTDIFQIDIDKPLYTRTITDLPDIGYCQYLQRTVGPRHYSNHRRQASYDYVLPEMSLTGWLAIETASDGPTL